MKRRLLHLVFGVLVGAAYLGGALAPADRALTDLRFQLSDRAPTGDIVIAEIDSRSLRELDTWPWPRSFHARLIDRLVAAGARVIALDVDFSSRSNDGTEDEALAQAIRRANGHVILPAFRRAADRGTGDVASALPIAPLREAARIGSVSVPLDAGSRIRRYEPQTTIGGVRYSGMAAQLAGRDGPGGESFLIDFSIDAERIPRLSVADVIRGRFDPALVAGKRVIVGSTAVELSDWLPVPMGGLMAGPVLQAVVAETILQGRTLFEPPAAVGLALCLLVALLLGPAVTGWPWRRGLACVVGVAGGALAVSYFAQADLGVVLDVTAPVLVTAGAFLLGLLRKIDRLVDAVFRERMTSQHRRVLINAVIDNSFHGIVITDEHGVVEVVNTAAEHILGRSADDLAGVSINDYLPPPVAAGAAQDDAADAVPLGVPYEVQLAAPDGEARSIEVLISRARYVATRRRGTDGTGSENVYLYAFQDITPRAKAMKAERAAMERAVAADRAKTEFLANISHELRTPLNAVIGFSDMILSEALGPVGNPVYMDYLGDINRSGVHLLEVVNDVLDMSRIEAGETTLNETTLDLGDAVESSVRLLRVRAHDGGVRLEVATPSDEILLRCDARQVKQILLNLVGNAIKFTPDGGDVKVHMSRENDGSTVIAVRDTGIGIAADKLEMVFEPFAQADSRLERTYEGTGLGLPLVRRMMELHGGSVTLESETGVGTTATVRFGGERAEAARAAA